MRSLTAYSLLALALLTGCNPSAADPKQEILGRWESREWVIGETPMYAQFTEDGQVQHMTRLGTDWGKWMFLESGDLQVSYSSGRSESCAVEFGNGFIRLTPPTCFRNWDRIGPSATFFKK